MRRTTIISWKDKTLIPVTLFLALFFVFFVPEAKSQKADFGIDEIKGLFDVHRHTPPKYSGNQSKPKNEFQFLMASGFNVYKAFFSSQDNPSCVFYPSCSEYSVLSFQQKGLLMGTLYTFDRLSRCHHFVKPGQYVFDPSKERFYDPLR